MQTSRTFAVMCVLLSCFVFVVSCSPQRFVGVGPSLGEPRADLVAASLRCEYLVNPLGVGERQPRLSWILESRERDQRQSAYRIVVASTREQLARGTGDLWDTGKIDSSESVNIEYRGKALSSRQACFWKVQAWDRDGKAGAWSEIASWEMGLLNMDDWTARWIDVTPSPVRVEIRKASYETVDGSVKKDVTESVRKQLAERRRIEVSNDALGGDPAVNVRKRLVLEYSLRGNVRTETHAEHAVVEFSCLPYLRRNFEIVKPIVKARVFATALGLYELSLNGQRVGDDEFAPGWTDYRKRVRYQVFDVTNLLRQRSNTIGAVVAPGWFSGRCGLFHARKFYGDNPALLVQLELTYTDGSTERIVSDGSWQRHDGPLLAADIMDGEMYDARTEIERWCEAASDEGWTPVRVRDESRVLEASVDRPVRVLQELKSKSVHQTKTGTWIFDVGQNMVGVARLKVREKPGTVITIRHGELLNPDGTLYTANLRGAAAVDTYVCKGDSVEEWRPRFTFHGFRYVEVAGLTNKPDASTITGVVLGSDLTPTGQFECSDSRLNQLQSNIQWGLRGNYFSVPTDCPQRDERMGWMADAQVFLPTAAFNADLSPFMTKWLVDVSDAQREDGAHSDVAPVMKGLTYGTPAWADAGTIVPLAMYETYGDTRILERHIDSMKRWVDWCNAHSTNLIRDKDRGNDYGDWLSINADTPKDLIGTAYFARSTEIVAKALRVLRRDAEAQTYESLHAKIRDAFVARYVDSEGRMAGNTQCGYVLVLKFELMPEHLREKAAGHLVADIKAKDWHISTGFVGVSMLLPVLEEAGYADVAYRLLQQDTFPSWLYSVKQGATTIWERWDGATEKGPHPDIGMNSFNHYALGSCGEWLFAGVAGIRADEPGFTRIAIRPNVTQSLTWAKGTYQSVRGEVSSRWEVREGQLSLHVKVPVNTTATVHIPHEENAQVLESGVELANAKGVVVKSTDSHGSFVEVGSGEYTFVVPYAFSR